MRFKIIVMIASGLIIFTTAAFGASAGNTTSQATEPGITSAAPDTAPAPLAVVDSPTHAFEAVIDGTFITHDFVIKNNGNADLHIQKVKTG